MLKRFCDYPTWDGRRLGAWLTADISETLLEEFHASLHKAGRVAPTRNHYTTPLKSLFRWAARKGVIVRSPISHESTLRRVKVARRRRRVSVAEETALLAVAGAVAQGPDCGCNG